MKFQTTLSAAALALVLPTTTVLAEDWTGAYFGATGGYSWGAVDAGAFTVEGGGKAKIPVFIADGFNALDPEGAEMQVFAGYRMQSGGLVYGGEIGVSFGSVEDSVVEDFTFGTSYFARGIVGTEASDYLLFGSLGVVSTEISSDSLGFDQDNAFGVSLGVGVERMLTDQLSLRTELIHTIYSDQDLIVDDVPTITMETGLSRTSLLFGVAYRF